MFFFLKDSGMCIPKHSDNKHMPMYSSIYAHTHTHTNTQLQPSAQALFSLFPVSHPTTLRSFLSLLAAWDKIQNTRRDGCKLASVNTSLWALTPFKHCPAVPQVIAGAASLFLKSLYFLYSSVLYYLFFFCPKLILTINTPINAISVCMHQTKWYLLFKIAQAHILR